MVRSRITDNEDTNLFHVYVAKRKYREGLFLTLRKARIYSQLSLKTDTSRGGTKCLS